jgi:hypothetical protein
MSENLTTLLQLLCEIDPPEISRQWIDQHELRDSVEALIEEGALVPVENADSIVCEFCDEQHWIPAEYLGPGHCRGLCPDSGFHSFSPNLLERFAVDDVWIVGGLATTLSLRPRKTLFSGSSVFHVGRARFGPYDCEIFFGRRLHDRSRFENGMATLQEKIGGGIGVLLTSTRLDLLPGSPPERCAIMMAEDVLTISRGKVCLDQAAILAALREPTRLPKGGGVGFRYSLGFRACVYGGQQFRFSDKQALAIEALYDARKDGLQGLHQKELKGRVDTSQRMTQLFYKHPAYGTLIKNDGSGLYWLDL